MLFKFKCRFLQITTENKYIKISYYKYLKSNTFFLNQLDVICVDLDGGVISVPECVTLPQIPEPFYTSTVETLTKVCLYTIKFFANAIQL